MESWYFAYGSNLLVDQMIARTGMPERAERPPRIARLADYRLVFQHLAPGEPAFANIVSPGEGLLGVVYSCTPAVLEKLDSYEHGYARLPVRVTDQLGEVLAASAYIVQPAAAPAFGSPNAAYLQKIVHGAWQHGLPPEYIESIVAIATVANPGSVCRPESFGS